MKKIAVITVEWKDKIRNKGNELIEFLLAKNESYGNSALEPRAIFASGNASELIRVRIDDKINRLMQGSAYGEDAVVDLAGYLILLMVVEDTCIE